MGGDWGSSSHVISVVIFIVISLKYMSIKFASVIHSKKEVNMKKLTDFIRAIFDTIGAIGVGTLVGPLSQ